jgi:hypothetical protein
MIADGESVKNILNRRKKKACRQTSGRFLRNDVNIPVTCNRVPVQSKVFTTKALDAVASDRISDPSRYGNPKAGPVGVSGTDKCKKISVLDLFTGLRQPKKIGSLKESVCLGKGKIQKG